jgi:hypothetical protein
LTWGWLQAERARGRADQPRFEHRDVMAAWLGAQPGNIVLGNTMAALVSVACVQ